MKEEKKTYSSYEEVGQDVGLDNQTLRRYVFYMRERWASEETLHCAVGYAKEWAERFKSKSEYTASDMGGIKLLREIDAQVKGVCCLSCGKRITKLEYSGGKCFVCGGSVGPEEQHAGVLMTELR